MVTLAVALPASAQGKSGQAHGKAPAPRPSASALPTASPTASAGPAASVSPFAWLDDANVLEAGAVWLGVSMLHWQGSGVGETIVPVIDGAVGLTPRIQVAASVPRVAGGVGTIFFSAKIAAFKNADRGLKVAVSPTLEVLNQAAALAGPAGQSRTQWGLPVSVELDRDSGRIYGSSGYFSPGIWYAGAGFGKPVSDRVGLSVSFTRAWATSPSAVGAVPIDGLHRTEISGGGSFDINPNMSIFGSLGRTIGVAAENGAGTTISFGLSLSAGPGVFERR